MMFSLLMLKKGEVFCLDELSFIQIKNALQCVLGDNHMTLVQFLPEFLLCLSAQRRTQSRTVKDCLSSSKIF